jgi:putative peptidoglycan lipid II flippase
VPLIGPILAGALGEESRILARRISLELSPIIFLITARSFLAAVSHSRRSFLNPTYALALVPAGTVGCLFLFHDRLGIHSLVLGNNVGFLLAAVFLYLSLRLAGIRIGIGWRFDRRILATLRLSLPQVLSASVLKLNPLIDRMIASYLAVGCISALAYAERIQSVPLQVLNLGFFNVVLAHWSFARSEDGLATVKKSLQEVQQLLLSLALPLFLYLWIFRRTLIGLVLEHGALDASGADTISSVYGVYLMGLLPLFLTMVYVRVFLVLKDTVFLMKVGFFNVASKLLLNLTFVFLLHLGVEGIALSTTITSWVILFIMVTALRARLGELPFRFKVKETLLLVAASAGVSAMTSMLWNGGRDHFDNWLLVGMCSVFFFSSYLLFMYMLKDETYLKLRSLVWRR